MNSSFNQSLPAERPEGGMGLSPDTSGRRNGLTSSNEFVDIHEAVRQPLQGTGVQTGGLSEDVSLSQLRLRIKDLEAQMLSRNLELQDKDRLERNYKAALEQLMKVKAEKEVIEEDREKCYKEMEHYRQQAEDKTKENDVNKERLTEMIRQLTDKDKRIRSLEKVVLLRKEKCRTSCEVNDGENEVQYLRPIKEDTKACNKRRLDSHCQPKRRRHTFHQTPTVLPSCKNCSTVFDLIQPHDIQCRFHRSRPQPLKTWKKQLGENNQQFDLNCTQAYLYWPCCGKAGLKEPPGCLKLRTHDLSTHEQD